MTHNPHANFSPTLEGYSGQTPFRYWCQLALPLTYDDSLSYYELLNKVVSYVNNTIEDVANVETNVGRLSDAYNQLQNYVNDYFDNIDIEQELRTVLDRMALDGTLDEILSPIIELQLPSIVEDQIDEVVSEQIGPTVENQIGATVENQIDDVVAEQLPVLANNLIPNEVTSWLNEHVTPVGGAVVVDNTLSISDAAADAKTTGDKISELKNAFNTTLNPMTWTPILTKAEYINSESGKRVTGGDVALKYARTGLWNGYEYRNAIILNNPNYEYRMMYYTADGSLTGSDTSGYLGCSTFVSGLHYIPSNAIQFALSIRRVDQEPMTDSNVAEISAALSCYAPTDRTLSKQGISADAKTTGDRITSLEDYNSVDILPKFASYSNTSRNGVTYTFADDKKSCLVNGTATALSFANFYNENSALPNSIHPGHTYYMKVTRTGGGVSVVFQFYINGVAGESYFFNEDGSIKIPENATGMLMRLRVGSGSTVNNVTITFAMLTTNSNKGLSEITDSLSESYSAVPVITTDSLKLSPAVASSLLKWTPLADCSALHHKDTVQIGIPYHSNAHRSGRDVFINRNVSTFASAVKNPASIIYTQADINEDDVVYGSMCSSFTAWLIGKGEVRITEELYYNYIDKYEYRGPTSIQIGDTLISYNSSSGGHSMMVCGIELDAKDGTVKYINIIESVHPNVKYTRYTVSEFENLLNTYDIGRYKNFTVLDSIPPLRYATDIITEYGNETWYKNGDEIWCYMRVVPETIYVTDKDTQQTTEVTVGNLPTKTVDVGINTYTLYDISGALTQDHEYAITTDPTLKNKANILIVSPGTMAYNSATKKVSIDPENVTPTWAYIYGMNTSGESGTRIKYNNDDVFEFDGNELDVSALFTDGIANYPYFKLYVYYPTKYGQAVFMSSVFSTI